MEKITFTNGNGTSMSFGYGCEIGMTNITGLTESGLDIQGQTTPMYDGQAYIDALIQPRIITATLSLCDGNNLLKREDRRRDVSKLMNPKYGEGVLIYTCDRGSRKIKGVPQLAIFKHKNSNDKNNTQMTVTWKCMSPYWEDIENTTVEVNGNNEIEIINNGDVSSPVKIELGGTVIKNAKISNGDSWIKYNGVTGDINGRKVIINTQQGNKSAVDIETNDFSYLYSAIRLTDVAYGNGMYIAVGDSGTVLSSLDGTKWGIQSLGVTNAGNIRGVHFDRNSKLFELVSDHYFARSKDGITWILSDYYETLNCNKLYYSSLYYVTVGDNNIIKWSMNGFAWNDITYTHSTNYNLYGVAGNVSTYIAVGKSGHIVRTTNAPTAWSEVSSGITVDLWGIEYDNGVWVAGGGDKTIIYSTDDGVTWHNAIKTGDENAHNVFIRDIVYGNGKFVAISPYGNSYYSTDGINWTYSQFGSTGNNQQLGICYGGGKYVSVGYYNRVYCSVDGINDWKLYLNERDFLYINYLEKIRYLNNIYIGVGQGSIQLSQDGAVWESNDMFYYDQIFDVAYGAGVYIFTSTNGKIYKSIDLTSSTQVESGLTKSIYGVIYALGYFWAVGRQGQFIQSLDGENWNNPMNNNITNFLSNGTGNPLLNLNKIFFKNGNFYAIGENEILLKSSDGYKWTQCHKSTSGAYNSIISGDGILVVVGNGGNGLISSDNGNTWTEIILGTEDYYDVAYNGSNFIAVGNNGRYSISDKDGLNWTEKNYSLTTELKTIVYNDNKVIVGGKYNLILSSSIKPDNAIQYITGDMSFSLNTGRNYLNFENELQGGKCKITYTQRYLGV